jgi:acyl-CoA dehydrogenase
MRAMAHDFAEKEIRPVAWDYDRHATWPQEIINKAWELGLLNAHSPPSTAAPASPTSTAA